MVRTYWQIPVKYMGVEGAIKAAGYTINETGRGIADKGGHVIARFDPKGGIEILYGDFSHYSTLEKGIKFRAFLTRNNVPFTENPAPAEELVSRIEEAAKGLRSGLSASITS